MGFLNFGKKRDIVDLTPQKMPQKKHASKQEIQDNIPKTTS